eukprot:8123223-Pyramimonas_sp.AAC.1
MASPAVPRAVVGGPAAKKNSMGSPRSRPSDQKADLECNSPQQQARKLESSPLRASRHSETCAAWPTSAHHTADPL